MQVARHLQRRWSDSLYCHHLCLIGHHRIRRGRKPMLNLLRAFLEDRDVILAGRRDGTLYALTADLCTVLDEKTFHSSGGVWCLGMDDTTDQIALGCGNGRVILMKAGLSEQYDIWLTGEDRLSYVMCVAFFLQGDVLLAGTEKSHLWAIRTADACLMYRLQLSGQICAMIALPIGPSRNTELLCGEYIYRLYLTETQLAGFAMTIISCITCVHTEILCFALDERRSNVLCGSGDGRIFIYSSNEHEVIYTCEVLSGFVGYEGPSIWALAYDRRTDRIFIGRQRGRPCILTMDNADGQPASIRMLGSENATVSAAFYLPNRGIYFGDNWGSINFTNTRNLVTAWNDRLNSVHVPWECCARGSTLISRVCNPVSCNNAVTTDDLFDIWCIGGSTSIYRRQSVLDTALTKV